MDTDHTRSVRQLSLPELKEIFQDHMKEDFPFLELRPWFTIERAWERDEYVAYGYYEGERLLAYAAFSFSAEDPHILMDYFAVVLPLRGQGIGSAFLRELRSVLPESRGVLIEAESARSAEKPEERVLRQRRLDFYRENGAVSTGISCHLFGVDYQILYLPGAGEDVREVDFWESVCGLYRALYRSFYGRLCRPYRDEDSDNHG